jgi:hypothetical protein
MFFGSKVERALNKHKKKDIPVDVRYMDGQSVKSCTVVRVERNKFIIEGFTEELRADHIEVSLPELKLWFDTRVTHTSRDIKGKILYHCPLPDDLRPRGKRSDRLFVYPRAYAAFTHNDGTTRSTTFTDDEGDAADMNVRQYQVWTINDKGLEFIDDGKYALAKNDLLEGKIKIGSIEVLVNARVDYFGHKPFREQGFKVTGCFFEGESKNMARLLEKCKRLDSQ